MDEALRSSTILGSLKNGVILAKGFVGFRQNLGGDDDDTRLDLLLDELDTLLKPNNRSIDEQYPVMPVGHVVP